jgi:5-methylthioadenosine/S-adenosylhomocysteine deaminase
MSDSLLTNVTVVPMDGTLDAPLGDIRAQSIRIRGGRIAALGPLTPEPGETTVDGEGLVVLPGFVQGHVHYCQTLFRGLADDLPLMDWLQNRIWPLEAAHDADSIRSSGRACPRMQRGGSGPTW